MAKKTSTAHFPSFSTLIQEKLFPHTQAHPTFERLDGVSGKGNQTIFATFDHQGGKWRINMDTRIERLVQAWELERAGQEPFVQRKTKTGYALRLNAGNPEKADGLYIYSVG